MVSVTGSVTWISHSPSVIGMKPDPRRQRDERHARRYRPERTAGSGETLTQRREADAIPRPGTAVKGRIPRSPTGAERGLNASEAGAYEVENRVRGEFYWHTLSAVPVILRVKRKGVLGHVGRFCELFHNLGDIIVAFATNVERQSISR